MVSQTFFTDAGMKIHLAAVGVVRVDQPGVNADQGTKFARNLVVSRKMQRFASNKPACMQRWEHGLRRVEVFQNIWCTGRQVVVEQNGAGVEVQFAIEAFEEYAVALATNGFKCQRAAIGQAQVKRCLQIGNEAADTDCQSGFADDVGQRSYVLQVKGVARVVFRNEQKPFRRHAHLFDRHLCRLHRQGQKIGAQVIKAAGKQIGIHRCQLEAGVAQINRTVERGLMRQPLFAKPVLNVGLRLNDVAFNVEQRAGQGGGEVRNHEMRVKSVASA